MSDKRPRFQAELFYGLIAILSISFLCSCAGMNKSTKPEWSQGERFERVGQFVLEGTAHQVFPLLCPVEEYKWLPDWSCTMFYSDSGIAEKNAAFQTSEILGMKVTWVTITYEPDKYIEYLLVSGIDIVRLSISLEEVKAGTSKVTWRMLFTTNSTLGKIAIKQAFSKKNFQRMMDDRREQLNFYLKNARKLRKLGTVLPNYLLTQ